MKILVSRITGKEVVDLRDIADVRESDDPVGGSYITMLSGSRIWVKESSVMLDILTEHHRNKQKIEQLLRRA